ncbi:MAG: hypothetical protein MPJ50_09440, partial [Pirellulales bacterium]|nr:hypothetical protein [Pirellulales bacterium]
MRIWDRQLRELLLRLDGAQFDFLNCQLTGPYLLILVELFRARQEEIKLELPLAELHDRIRHRFVDECHAESFEPGDLKKHLDFLKEKKNVSLRMEPKRLRRIQDRGVTRYQVRLSDRTFRLLVHLERESQTDFGETHASIQFNLADVQDALESVARTAGSDSNSHQDLFRVARHLVQARKSVEDAGREL